MQSYQGSKGSGHDKAVSLPVDWSNIQAYDRHVIKYAIDRAFKNGKIVALIGETGVGKSVLASEVCPDSLLGESAILKAMRHDKPITAKAVPVAVKGELVLDEAQMLCRRSDWNNFINLAKSHEMKVLVVAQMREDLPQDFLASKDVVSIHITKKIY